MKTINLINNKEIEKRVYNNSYYSVSNFCADCVRYAKAVKEGRLIVSVVSVSSSGLSRRVLVHEMNKTNGRFYLYNFSAFLRCLGYKLNDNGETTLNGCGMDLIFGMNYDICNTLRRLGVLSYAEYEKLSQERINMI